VAVLQLGHRNPPQSKVVLLFKPLSSVLRPLAGVPLFAPAGPLLLALSVTPSPDNRRLAPETPEKPMANRKHNASDQLETPVYSSVPKSALQEASVI
ncbi:MAG: hypothetical protein OXU42_07645, partial [Deltaproteobacteria bacterium]|nr:hypothetical protein [Deltaproteobacteria bacterium]